MYNKPKIMKTSHQIYRAGGVTQSEALRRAWRIAKIDNQLFALSIVDRQSAEEKATVRALEIERCSLMVKKAPEADSRIDAERKLFESMGFVWNEGEQAWIPNAA